MKVNMSQGICSICGTTVKRVEMTRHIQRCGVPDPKAPVTKRPANPSFHLFVDGRYAKKYWMHLAVPADSPLSTLDAFLRRIWLECCDHMSAFTIDGDEYSESMDESLDEIIKPGMVFTYEYDFGSTTELIIKVAGYRDAPGKKQSVELLARNDAPVVVCQICGALPATQICADCNDNDKGWLCDTCAEAHDCGTEMCMPIPNSPRAGVCGYTG